MDFIVNKGYYLCHEIQHRHSSSGDLCNSWHCRKCINCYNQSVPIFDSTESSSYKPILRGSKESINIGYPTDDNCKGPQTAPWNHSNSLMRQLGFNLFSYCFSSNVADCHSQILGFGSSAVVSGQFLTTPLSPCVDNLYIYIHTLLQDHKAWETSGKTLKPEF